MTIKDILEILQSRYKSDKYRIKGVKQQNNEFFCLVTDISTGEKIKVMMDDEKIIETGEGYTITLIKDNDGKFNPVENNNGTKNEPNNSDDGR